MRSRGVVEAWREGLQIRLQTQEHREAPAVEGDDHGIALAVLDLARVVGGDVEG